MLGAKMAKVETRPPDPIRPVLAPGIRGSGQSRREEKQLEREFGNEWLRYKGEVRRWL
jgi:hypothetical protein